METCTHNNHLVKVTAILIVLHLHSCVPLKSQVSSSKEPQLCYGCEVQCSTTYTWSIVADKVDASMHLSPGSQSLEYKVQVLITQTCISKYSERMRNKFIDLKIFNYVLSHSNHKMHSRRMLFLTTKERPLFALKVVIPLKLRGNIAVLTAPPLPPLLLKILQCKILCHYSLVPTPCAFVACSMKFANFVLGTREQG